MFNPTREQVRLFFTDAWKKHQAKGVLTPLEMMAVNIIQQHPEYHADMVNPEISAKDFLPEQGKTNPFLHLSMHLAITEQLSIDQPPGIKAAYQSLLGTNDAHDAMHIIMDALGEIIWEAQRLKTPFDNDRYLDLIRRHTTRH